MRHAEARPALLLSRSPCDRAQDFPYNFEPGVAHHLLWASKPLPPETITSIIQEQLPFHETLWWINPPELQSIQAVRTSMEGTVMQLPCFACFHNVCCCHLIACACHVLAAVALPCAVASHIDRSVAMVYNSS